MRTVSIFICLVLVVGVCFADNSKRIEELRTEGQQLLQEKQRATQVINNINVRLAEIQGAIQELTRLDSKEEKK